MARLSLKSLLALAFLILCAAPVGAASADKDLEGIKKKIERERQGISQVRKKEGSVLQSLSMIEKNLEKKTKDLNAANSKVRALLDAIQQKEAEAQQLKVSVEQRRELLMKRAAALYRWLRGGSPLVMLDGDVPPGVVMQRQRYLEATVRFDRELVHKLSDEAAYQESVKSELAGRKEQLDNQRRILVEVQDSIRKDAEKKKQLLASLRQEKVEP
jgi:septal ring factor EnvC (AmiA/AmiB activator)